MKKFLTNILIFSIITFASISFILSKADGYSDPFYLKYTTPKQRSLIIGSSKAAQGLLPDIFQKELDVSIYNYSFSISDSPFGPHYFESIKRKLTDNESDHAIFILTVDCWGISSRCVDPNDTTKFRENNSSIAKIEAVDQKPNLPYLFHFMSGNYHRILHKSPALLHDNGWLEVSLGTDPKSVNRRTKNTLMNFRNSLEFYNYSDIRFEYLIKTINYLKQKGNVYLVRLPVSPGLMDIEDQLIPDFNERIARIANQTSGYFDMSIYNDQYEYTDGVHLQKESAKKTTEQISKWIGSIENIHP